MNPARSLALIEAQRSVAAVQLGGDDAFLYTTWGLAYLVGFGAAFLRFGGPGGVSDPIVDLPTGLAAGTFGLSLVVGMIVTVTHFARRGRGVSGPGQDAERLVGWSWFLGFFLAGPLAGVASANLPENLAFPLTSALFVHIAGVMFMFCGALVRDRVQFRLGLWISVASAAGLAVGPLWHPLVCSVLAGGGMLVAAAVSAVRRRQP